jgi:hypothetical protein
VLQNSLKFTFLPSQIFYNFLGIFGILPNYFGNPNFLIYFPKNRNQILMDFLFSFLLQPNRPAHSFGLGLPAGPNRLAHLASQPLGPRMPLAYFAEDVFFIDSLLPFSAPSLSPLTDTWAPLVISFLHPTSANPNYATTESRRIRPLRAAAPHLEMPRASRYSPHHHSPPLQVVP